VTTKSPASVASSTRRHRPPGYESTLGGVLVHNAFLRIPVEEVLTAAGLELVHLASSASVHPPLRILIAGLEELGPHGAQAVTGLRKMGTAVLVFGRPEQAAALRALQACGALTAERTTFLVRMPELVQLGLAAPSRR
jgi:hypothetical protein